MNTLGDCQRPKEGGGGGGHRSTDNELPKSEKTASAAVSNFSCQSLERETDRKTDKRKGAFEPACLSRIR